MTAKDGPKRCSFPGCTNFSKAHGLCSGHGRQRSNNVTLTPLRKIARVVDGTKVCITCGRTYALDQFKTRNGAPTSPCLECRGVLFRVKTYGLTREQAVAMVDGACQACGTHADSKNMHVDHDHVTGAVRGLLCHGCNTTLGLLNEDVERIRALVAYVERHS